MGAGEDVAWWPARIDAVSGSQVDLAVGPGDVEHGGQVMVGVVEPGKQRENAIQPKDVGGVERRAKAVELGLDRGVRGHRIVGHQAAFLALSGIR